MSLPAICADLDKLKHNIDKLAAMCHTNGMTMAAVTKCVCAEPAIVELINATGADFIADSRVANLAAVKTQKPRMLIRVPMLSEVAQAVEHSDIALISEEEAIEAFAAEARAQKKRYKLVLMVDMGDLREGIFFRDTDAILGAAGRIVRSDYVELYGVGVNLSCYGGILPDDTNLGGLVEIAERLRGEFDIELPMVSGGNSSTMGMLQEGRVPGGITNLRLGESYLLGNDTSDGGLISGLNPDAFTLSAEIVELKHKPSKPIGKAGLNAFGEEVHFEDRGQMRRGILALGRQDTNPDGLTPVDARIEVLGGSSDHTIVNLTDAPEYSLGDTVDFTVDYGALLKAYTSKYIARRVK